MFFGENLPFVKEYINKFRTPDLLDFGANIYYNKDGSEPTTNSLAYTIPLTLTKTTTIKAKAFKSNYIPSDTAHETYTYLSYPFWPCIGGTIWISGQPGIFSY